MAPVDNQGVEGDLTVEAKLLKLKEYLQGTIAYQDFPGVFRDDWLKLTLMQKKNGKTRTLDYALQKLQASVKSLEDLNLLEFEKSVPNAVKQDPMIIKVGVDHEGRDVLAIDWARVDLDNIGSLWKDYLKYAALSTVNALKQSPKPQYLIVDFLRKSKAKDVIRYARAVPSVRKMANVMETVFYDRIFQRFVFPPKPLVKIVQLVRVVLPENAKAKMIMGSYKYVRKELQQHCEAEKFLPRECGGTADLNNVQIVLV